MHDLLVLVIGKRRVEPGPSPNLLPALLSTPEQPVAGTPDVRPAPLVTSRPWDAPNLSPTLLSTPESPHVGTPELRPATPVRPQAWTATNLLPSLLAGVADALPFPASPEARSATIARRTALSPTNTLVSLPSPPVGADAQAIRSARRRVTDSWQAPNLLSTLYGVVAPADLPFGVSATAQRFTVARQHVGAASLNIAPIPNPYPPFPPDPVRPVRWVQRRAWDPPNLLPGALSTIPEISPAGSTWAVRHARSAFDAAQQPPWLNDPILLSTLTSGVVGHNSVQPYIVVAMWRRVG